MIGRFVGILRPILVIVVSVIGVVLLYVAACYFVEPTRLVLVYTGKDRLDIDFLTEAALRRELELLSREESLGRCDEYRIRLVGALIYSDLRDSTHFLGMMGKATDLELRAPCLSDKNKYLSARLMVALARDRQDEALSEKYVEQARAWSAVWQQRLDAEAAAAATPLSP